MVFTVAERDLDRALAVRRWPIIAVLRAYEAILRDNAAEIYRHDVLVWRIETTVPLAKGKRHRAAPKLPDLLKD